MLCCYFTISFTFFPCFTYFLNVLNNQITPHQSTEYSLSIQGSKRFNIVFMKLEGCNHFYHDNFFIYLIRSILVLHVFYFLKFVQYR